MSKHRVVVLKIVAGQLTVTEAAEQYGLSRRQLHRLLARYREHGLDAVDPQSRRPRSNPRSTPREVVDRIVALRTDLTARGLDAGPVTIRWHLEREGLHVPSPATIHRILTRAGLITPEPRKRPRSSYIRFEAAQPNETWQSDFTHWRLTDGTDVEILNWLDDHSRKLLSCTVHTPVTGDDVVTTFLTTTEEYGVPASTLTDNGRVYTARHGGGRNAFEHLLPVLGVKQKNGKPNHPQTQGKIERFHQTQKRWLAQQPTATTVLELQTQLDRLRIEYNEHRPHRALDRKTPSEAYLATPKALPGAGRLPDRYRLRYDRIDTDGHVSIRRAGRMHHLGIGRDHTGKRILAITDETTVTVVHLDTGEVLSEHTIDPARGYWRNILKPAGRWPQKRQMSRDI
ncbi:IS481 family transposase [Microbacterium pygmaeum]|uniref:Transposase InsO and inactivated derivatives n=1 Tax=Microbacterium pygmaeum TaxID=370764 RepID=A0A1G7YLV7_9MICO|nr:IS481 family transposase [Microbacterium pygmaeum]SDG89122.1 Transposase InsO and inactivated derivatives [Microbacterium pygmaeum]SDG97377.1 Transposase InsO and inactivated derivatives [Microbacterium pygmaeum]SDH23207.1 Transposase InsO and inactivated derivatives [Microbacterium pygmaeum]